MRSLAQPKGPAGRAGSADAPGHAVVQRRVVRPDLSLKLAIGHPPGPALQRREAGAGRAPAAEPAADGMHAIAERGFAGSAGTLPHLPVLQSAFGEHDLSGVKAYAGAAPARAASQIGARAYTVGDRIAFAEPPDLRTAAHEATHVLQQRSGVHLPEGVGRPDDRYERHADAVASAVVDRRPVTPLLDPLGPDGDPGEAVQRKEAGEEDVDAIERAGKRANDSVAKGEESDTQMMLDASSIFFRLMQNFFPEVLAKWHFSGVAYKREYGGISIERHGSDVHVTVGREFVLGAREHGLASRVIALEVALEMLEGGPAAIVAATTSTGGPPSRAEAVKEAGSIFAAKAEFGVTSGSGAGPDENDGYDARFWTEAGRVIVAKGEPWYAMSQMIVHLGEPVPKEGGGTTTWHFDCYEGAQVSRLYADWRTLSREEFNRKNSPLQIGFFSTRASYYEKPVQVDQPGGAPYTKSDEPQPRTDRQGRMTFDYIKTPVGKTTAQVLDEAPPGAWIIWTNKDVTARIRAFSSRKEAGETLPPADQELYDRISPWENENALKVSKDRYAAFPFGVVDEKTIVEGMAEIVFRPNAVPAGYIAANIFISAIQIPKETRTTSA